MTSQPLVLIGPLSFARHPRTRLAALAIAAAVLAGCGSDAPTESAPPPAAQPQASATTAEQPPAAAKAAGPPRVADLMKQLGCAEAAVIGTQLYSRETGRCQAAGGTVTVAAFDSADLRDQWVAAGKQYGGNVVVGDGWALFAEGPDDADAAAEKLGGRKA